MCRVLFNFVLIDYLLHLFFLNYLRRRFLNMSLIFDGSGEGEISSNKRTEISKKLNSATLKVEHFVNSREKLQPMRHHHSCLIS